VSSARFSKKKNWFGNFSSKPKFVFSNVCQLVVPKDYVYTKTTCDLNKWSTISELLDLLYTFVEKPLIVGNT